ncbi:MAG TPA: DUF1993 domain-containing protein [Burkholderiaceae bacterium]|jgi:hypothetical protein|nr:DUF1993 domain-containing protein [Burkholderiaceae bacterium]
MATHLYDHSVANYLQTLAAVSGFLDKGLAHFTATQTNPDDIVEFRLAADMLPFRFQIESVAHHSLGAIEGMKKGVFSPPGESPPRNYAGLQQLIADSRKALEAMTPADVNALSGRDMVFEMRGRQMPFTTDNFALSFSLPNFYFHSATAYDILRLKGVPLGKRDFLGPLRLKT